MSSTKFSIDEYAAHVAEETKKIKNPKWRDFNGQDFQDPHTLMLFSMFCMLRHIMFKLATDKTDANVAAYAETGFELAMETVSDMGFKLSEFKVDSGLESMTELDDIRNMLIDMSKKPKNKHVIKQKFNLAEA